MAPLADPRADAPRAAPPPAAGAADPVELFALLAEAAAEIERAARAVYDARLLRGLSFAAALADARSAACRVLAALPAPDAPST
jgi:hypothetical protein